jgi:hypothetical protein
VTRDDAFKMGDIKQEPVQEAEHKGVEKDSQ